VDFTQYQVVKDEIWKSENCMAFKIYGKRQEKSKRKTKFTEKKVELWPFEW
jgi:hypothetical protein